MADETTHTAYENALAGYLRERPKNVLAATSSLAERLIGSRLMPEEIVALHFEVLPDILREVPPRSLALAVGDAHHFLLEVIIAYGARYREYVHLKVLDSLQIAEEAATRLRAEVLRASEREELVRGAVLSVAHEVRSPLAVAIASVELSMRALERMDAARVPALLGEAKGALDRLTTLTGHFAETVSTHELTLHRVSLDLARVVQQAVAWAMVSVTTKGLTLVFHSPPQPIHVYGDEDSLLSVCGNLLSNAVRYTPHGGQIDVSLRVDGDCSAIVVSDTGIGIAPEELSHIFDRFYRSDRARQMEPGGMGVGLALTKQLVEAHGGSLIVESRVDVGTSVTVRLPLGSDVAVETQ